MVAKISLDDWLAQVKGRFIDMDNGFPVKDPYQCWDLWAHYAVYRYGVPVSATYTNFGGLKPHPGYACNVFHNFPRVSALTDKFTQHSADVSGQPGDVAFWEKGGYYAGSHVAVVVRDNGNGTLLTMSQNKGPGWDKAGYETLSKRDLLGYLRPKPKKVSKPDAPKPPVKTPAELEEDEFMTLKEDLFEFIEQQHEETRRQTKAWIDQLTSRMRREARPGVYFVETGADGKKYTQDNSPYAAVIHPATGEIFPLNPPVNGKRGQIKSLKERYRFIAFDEQGSGFPEDVYLNTIKDLGRAFGRIPLDINEADGQAWARGLHAQVDKAAQSN